MDELEFEVLFRGHVHIAYRILRYKLPMSKVPLVREAMEVAEQATKEAILTWDKNKGKLSTHVTWTARAHRLAFLRHTDRWRGIHPATKERAGPHYMASRGTTFILNSGDTGIEEEENRDTVEDYVRWYWEATEEPDRSLVWDVLDFCNELELERKMFRGRLTHIIRNTAEGHTQEQIATQLNISRDMVNKILIEARKLFGEKFRYLIDWD
jgi:hypothetical protein